ncbi:glycosyl hydrolase family 43 [Pelomonas sp. KK5]|uniref:glucosamine inositolphosphorylceramide transferase family protein n=1 Tax=Pelomonas sp. KK5 TaxID=1855730 RepID=UPI00097BB70F|nr:glycosyl hydrolase family 43 [Pelomonas sp. KK5]
MLRRPRSDLWQVGIVPAPVEQIATVPGSLAAQRERICWLPDAGPWRYLADPFGLRRGDATHVYVEAYDYRDKHAVIERHEFGPDLQWRGKSIALARPFHLSYPFLIERWGEVFMVPESHKAGEIALYRARRFPDDWVRETVLLPELPGADATLIEHGGQWWMFYTLVGPGGRDQRELHVAFADQLTGPWYPHPMNPVLDDRGGARPGGTPFIDAQGHVVLPVQDCRRGYGGALRFLRFTRLDDGIVACEHLPAQLEGGMASATHAEGLHTLSRCGADLALIDVKTISRSRERQWLDLKRRWKRLRAR